VRDGAAPMTMSVPLAPHRRRARRFGLEPTQGEACGRARLIARVRTNAVLMCPRQSRTPQNGQYPGSGRSIRSGAPTGSRNVTTVSAMLLVSFLRL